MTDAWLAVRIKVSRDDVETTALSRPSQNKLQVLQAAPAAQILYL